MKLNSKGIAISGILYAALILFMTLMLGVLVMASTRKVLLDKTKNEILKKLDIKKQITDDLSNYLKNDMLLFYDGITNTQKIRNRGLATNIFEDLSGNGRNGLLLNFEFNETSGWTENSLRFDGVDSGVNMGNQLIDLFKNSATIEMLISFDELNARDIIFGNYQEEHNINWEKYSTTNSARIYWDADEIDQLFDNAYAFTTPRLLALVLDKDSSQIKFLVNGSVIAEHTDPLYQSYNYDFVNSWIGRDGRTGSTVLKGEVYAVRIYGKALTEDEIQYNYSIDQMRYGI